MRNRLVGGKGASDSVDISVLRRRPKSCAVFVKKKLFIMIYSINPVRWAHSLSLALSPIRGCDHLWPIILLFPESCSAICTLSISGRQSCMTQRKAVCDPLHDLQPDCELLPSRRCCRASRCRSHHYQLLLSAVFPSKLKHCTTERLYQCTAVKEVASNYRCVTVFCLLLSWIIF